MRLWGGTGPTGERPRSKHRAANDNLGLTPWLLCLGILIRLIMIYHSRGPMIMVEAGEATRVAISLATGGGFADAFPGMGPTAHLMPVMPLLVSGVLFLFGAHSSAALTVLLIGALVQFAVGLLLIDRVYARLGSPPAARHVGLAFFCLVPIFAKEELIDFRFWEGALAVVLSCCGLLAIGRVRNGELLSPARTTGAGALAAFTFFVSPPAGLGIVAAWIMTAIPRLPQRRVVLLGSSAAIALALMVTPWAMRNAHAMGAPILLRDNFGLEFALGIDPAVGSGRSSSVAYEGNYARIHPYRSVAARARLRAAGGEVAYSRMLGHAAWGWVTDHPMAFARLALRHYAAFFFPQVWQSGDNHRADARPIILSLINLLGFAALLFDALSHRFRLTPIGVFVLATALPYALVQPIPRYSYLVYGLMCFAAMGLVHRCVQVVATRYAARRLTMAHPVGHPLHSLGTGAEPSVPPVLHRSTR